MPEQWEPRPTPNVTPESDPYWRAASEARLLLGECPECDLVFHYPRARCPDCFAEADHLKASGQGEVYTFSVAHRMEGWPEADLPLAIGYVELAEGPRLLTGFYDCVPEELAIWGAVEVRFVPTADPEVAVPVFTPI